MSTSSGPSARCPGQNDRPTAISRCRLVPRMASTLLESKSAAGAFNYGSTGPLHLAGPGRRAHPVRSHPGAEEVAGNGVRVSSEMTVRSGQGASRAGRRDHRRPVRLRIPDMKLVALDGPGERPGSSTPTASSRPLAHHQGRDAGRLGPRLRRLARRAMWPACPSCAAEPAGLPRWAPSAKMVCIGPTTPTTAAEVGMALPREPTLFIKAPARSCGPTIRSCAREAR